MSHVESPSAAGFPVLQEGNVVFEFLFAPMNLFLQGIFGILGLL